MKPLAFSRLTALVLSVILVVMLATPAKAEADALAAIAIVSVVIVGVIVIAYLIIANTAGSRRAEEGRIVRVACVGDACAGLLGGVVNASPRVAAESP